MSNQIKHRNLDHEPLVGLYYVAECIKCGWIGSSGELTEDDAQCLQPVGDDHCWGDTDEIDAERLLELLQAGAFDKPAAQPQGEPVAYWADDYGNTIKADHKSYNEKLGGAPAMVVERYTAPLYAEQPAPVAVVMPSRRSWSGIASWKQRSEINAWNACLDEVARLNTK